MDFILAVLIPLMGTSVGAACVFFLKGEISNKLQKVLLGFAAGVMVAASVWSLLIPSMDMSSDMGKFSFIPALTGFLLGIVFLLVMDSVIPHMHLGSEEVEGKKSKLQKTTMLLFAVVIHNFPEGAACGAILAGVLTGETNVTMAGAVTLSLGIAIQNIPEGAIISMPLHGEGVSKGRSFFYGVLSGVVEPIGAVLAILLASLVTPVLPYMLSFAAGAMIYVVVEELIPETAEGNHSNLGTIAFAIGFGLMMVLDVALG